MNHRSLMIGAAMTVAIVAAEYLVIPASKVYVKHSSNFSATGRSIALAILEGAEPLDRPAALSTRLPRGEEWGPTLGGVVQAGIALPLAMVTAGLVVAIL